MSVTEHYSALSDLLKPNGSRGSRVAASEAAKRVHADDSASHGVEVIPRQQKEGLLSAFAVKLWAGMSFIGALTFCLKCAFRPWCSTQHSRYTGSALLLHCPTPRATERT